jgi:hypothetical protein
MLVVRLVDCGTHSAGAWEVLGPTSWDVFVNLDWNWRAVPQQAGRRQPTLGATARSTDESTLRRILKCLHPSLDVMLVYVRWYAAYHLSLRKLGKMIAGRGVLPALVPSPPPHRRHANLATVRRIRPKLALS